MSVFEGHLAGEDDIESWAMERVRLVKNEFVETQKEKIAALYDWLILIHNVMVYTAGLTLIVILFCLSKLDAYLCAQS